LEPKRGAVAIQALSALTRVLEQERKIRAIEELVERMDTLENVLEEAEGRRTHARW
jgi:hypothetical protein